MKKILITAANEAKAYLVAHFIKNNEIIFGDASLQNFVLPKENSVSFAHEILALALDNQIDIIIPIRKQEIKSLLEAKVLFEEYGIQILTPDLFQLKDLDNLTGDLFSPSAKVESFTDFSKTLITLGYPNKKLAFGNVNRTLITINDEVKNLPSVLNTVNQLSFTQAAKSLNTPYFEPITIYEVEEELFSLDVLAIDNEIHFLQHLEENLKNNILNFFRDKKLKGFYKVDISGQKIVRVLVNSI